MMPVCQFPPSPARECILWQDHEVIDMTETAQTPPGEHEPLILERLSDLEDQAEYLEHYPDARGRAVINPLGDEVGVVDELYVNPRNRLVEMVEITFNEVGGYGGKTVLIPVRELEFTDDSVRILTHKEMVQQAPEYEPGGPMYEPYYEYWGTQLVGDTEEPSAGFVRPPGRLELEGEEDEELEEEAV